MDFKQLWRDMPPLLKIWSIIVVIAMSFALVTCITEGVAPCPTDNPEVCGS